MDKNDKLVLVKWIDSLGCSPTWSKLDCIELKPVVCKSVGFLYYSNDEYLVIVPHFIKGGVDIEQQGCGEMAIPRRSILKITELRHK